MELLDVLEKIGFLDQPYYLPSHRKYILVLCPFHPDTNPSFEIILKAGYKSRPEGFARCFACGKFFRNKIHLLLALRELPEFRGKIPEIKLRPVKETEFRIYDPDGNLAYVQEIWFYPEKFTKEARYAYIDSSGKKHYFIPPNTKRWMYGLDTLKKKIEHGEIVLFESPQDANALRFIFREQTVLATCGATNWHKHWETELLPLLKDRGYEKVCIIPQNDKPGREWAIKMYEKFKTAGFEVFVSFLCEDQKVKDFSEFVENIKLDIDEHRAEVQEIVKDAIMLSLKKEIPVIWYIAPNDVDKIDIRETSTGVLIKYSRNGKTSDLFLDAQVKHERNSITATVNVHSNVDYTGKLLVYKVNLSSPISFDRFQKAFDRDLPNCRKAFNINFPELLRQVVLEFVRRDRTVDLKTVKAVLPEWIIEPLVYKSAPSLVYAPKASGKTTLACLLGMVVQNGYPFPFKTQRCNVLYLDWEGFETVIKLKMQSIADYFEAAYGIKDPEYPLYIRCVFPLHIMADELRRIVVEKDIKFVIIDSLIPSIGGNISDAGTAASYFGIIRELNSYDCGVLVLNHVPKKDMESDTYTWLGSSMFGNLARIVWQINAQLLEDDLYLTLQCKYNNFDKILDPFEILFSFGQGGTVTQVKVRKRTLDLQALSIPRRVIEVLKQGKLSFEEIGEQVFSSKEEFQKRKRYLTTVLQRLADKGIVRFFDDKKWGLLAKDELVDEDDF